MTLSDQVFPIHGAEGERTGGRQDLSPEGPSPLEQKYLIILHAKLIKWLGESLVRVALRF